MARKQVATRLEEDTVKALDEYVESQETPDRNNADAFRRFVREGLANRDYEVAVADGGVRQFDDRLDKIEQQQHRNTIQQNAAVIVGVLYIAATIQFSLGSTVWVGLGVAVFVALVGSLFLFEVKG